MFENYFSMWKANLWLNIYNIVLEKINLRLYPFLEFNEK